MGKSAQVHVGLEKGTRETATTHLSLITRRNHAGTVLPVTLADLTHLPLDLDCFILIFSPRNSRDAKSLLFNFFFI